MDPTIKIVIDAINNASPGLQAADRDVANLRSRVQEFTGTAGVQAEVMTTVETSTQRNAMAALGLEDRYTSLRAEAAEFRTELERQVETQDAATGRSGLFGGALGKIFLGLSALMVLSGPIKEFFGAYADGAKKAAESGEVVADAYLELVENEKKVSDSQVRSLTVMTQLKTAWAGLTEAVAGLNEEERSLHEARQADLISDQQLAEATSELAYRQRLLNEARADGVVTLEEQIAINRDARQGMQDYAATVLEEVNPALEDHRLKLIESIEAEADQLQAMRDLQTFVSGDLDEAVEEHTKKQADLSGEMETVAGKIRDLNGMQHLTPAQEEELADLRAEYEDLRDEYTKNADEHQEATRRILFDLLSQRAAVDGLQEGEVVALGKIAEGWGLVDEGTVKAAEKFDQILSDYGAGFITVEEMQRRIGLVEDAAVNAAGDYELRFKITTEGQIPYDGSYHPNSDPHRLERSRAIGGPVSAGMAYLVHQDEVIVPQQDGMVYTPQQIAAAAAGPGDAGLRAVMESVDRKLDELPRELAAVLGTAIRKQSAL